ncbi:hypothetical protein LPN04_31225 [Rugamonas sp. A1-17]|nr:hypothetical protein [Rugamonas sp. A1-17]
MPDTSISHHNDLPEHLRTAGLYKYLDTHHQSYWRHAVDVSHQLLNRHREQHGSDVYYQDQFRADFLAAVVQTDLDQSAQFLGPFELNQSLRGAEKDSDPNWTSYAAALASLKAGPRGTALVCKSIYNGGNHWEVRVHTGGGAISDCSTMKRGEQPATLKAIFENVLSYEGYLARCQAEKEQGILRSYGRIAELSIRPGLKLQDVEISIDYKPRMMRFVVLDVLDNGDLCLGEGKMRGSSKVYAATISATRIQASNLLNVVPAPLKATLRDEATFALF